MPQCLGVPLVPCRFNLLQTLLLAVITGTLFLRGHIPTDTIQVGGAGQPATDASQLCYRLVPTSTAFHTALAMHVVIGTHSQPSYAQLMVYYRFS